MPKINPEVVRSQTVLIRLNVKEKAKIERFAESKGVTVSEAFRKLLERLDGD